MDAKTFVDGMERNQLLRLTGSWSWIVADRTNDFDAFIGRPMTQWDAIRQRTTDYIKAEQKVAPDGPDQPIVDLTRDLLFGLSSDGEDVPRMLLWAMSLDDVLLPGGKPDYWGGAPTDWDEAIYSWKHIPQGELHRQLYDSFKAEVLEPAKRIREVRMLALGQDKDSWCNDSALRSEWDKVLWDWFLGEVWIDPAVYVVQGYDRVLRREWWRRWRERLGPEEAARIGAPLPHGRNARHSLDEITAVDLLPPFHEVADLPQEQV